MKGSYGVDFAIDDYMSEDSMSDRDAGEEDPEDGMLRSRSESMSDFNQTRRSRNSRQLSRRPSFKTGAALNILIVSAAVPSSPTVYPECLCLCV